MTFIDVLKTIGISTIVAFFTALFTFLYAKKRIKLELTQEYNKKFNLNRWDIYLHFVNLISAAIHANSEESTIMNESRLEKLPEIDQKILLLGSTELIQRYGEWKVQQHMEGSSGYQTVISLTSVVNQMRNDLGEKGNLSMNQILDILHPGWQRSLQ